MLAEFIPGLLDGLTKLGIRTSHFCFIPLSYNKHYGKRIIPQKEAAVAAISAMYKRPAEELLPCFEEAATVYEFDDNDKMNWSKIVCFWFADEVFYGANQRAIEQQNEQPVFLYNLDVKMRCYHDAPWKVNTKLESAESSRNSSKGRSLKRLILIVLLSITGSPIVSFSGYK